LIRDDSIAARHIKEIFQSLVGGQGHALFTAI
jgi:hypothetical protein